MSWDTDVALLSGQELTVEAKPNMPFASRTSISHNFVSIYSVECEICLVISNNRDFFLVMLSHSERNNLITLFKIMLVWMDKSLDARLL